MTFRSIQRHDKDSHRSPVNVKHRGEIYGQFLSSEGLFIRLAGRHLASIPHLRTTSKPLHSLPKGVLGRLLPANKVCLRSIQSVCRLALRNRPLLYLRKRRCHLTFQMRPIDCAHFFSLFLTFPPPTVRLASSSKVKKINKSAPDTSFTNSRKIL